MMFKLLAALSATLIILSAPILSGCGETGDLSSAESLSPQPFNLLSIEVSDSGIATFNWGTSKEATEYTICRKDISKSNQCSIVASTSNLSLGVSIGGLLENINSEYFILARNGSAVYASSELSIGLVELNKLTTYVKASNTDPNDYMGYSVALSDDGSTLAVGAFRDASNATGVNGNPFDNSMTNAGSVFIYRYDGSNWYQQAYIKASNTESNDQFGRAVSISSDGNTLAVSASGESSDATGINGDESDNSAALSGAVYLYKYNGSDWEQQAYIKASNTDSLDQFGQAISLASDGRTLAVSATGESSIARGVNGDELNNSATNSGAVYLYRDNGNNWVQQAYIKASNTDEFEQFGTSVSLSSNGNTLAVGSQGESSNAMGINSDESNNLASFAGAVYLYRYNGSNWYQQAYIKASNTNSYDFFGRSISLAADGNTLAVGAPGEASNSKGIDGDEANNDSSLAGAAYLFRYENNQWLQTAYIKASNTDAGNSFGYSVALSPDASKLAVSAYKEKSSSTGINGDQNNIAANESGAVYLFHYNDNYWEQNSYIKASNTNSSDFFGYSIDLSSNGLKLAIGAPNEDSGDTGINGDQSDNSASSSGAVYIY